MNDAQTMRELLARYNSFLAKWVDLHGTKEGFNDWFTAQVTGGSAV